MISCLLLPVDHRYEYPGDEESFTLSPSQKTVGPSGMTEGFEGKGITVMRTLSEAWAVVERSVTVILYQVVMEGFATGFEIAGSLRPVVGVHEYE